MLCNQADVEQRLQIVFDNDPEPVITALITAAQGHIERVSGRKIEADDHTEVFDGGRRGLFVRNPPINTIAAVEEDGEALVEDIDFMAYPEEGRIIRVSAGLPVFWRTFKSRAITVDYNGGFTAVPPDLRDLCALVAARAFLAGSANAARPEGSEGVQQIALAGSDSVVFGENRHFEATASITRGVILTPEEIEAIETGSYLGVPYRIPGIA